VVLVAAPGNAPRAARSRVPRRQPWAVVCVRLHLVPAADVSAPRARTSHGWHGRSEQSQPQQTEPAPGRGGQVVAEDGHTEDGRAGRFSQSQRRGDVHGQAAQAVGIQQVGDGRGHDPEVDHDPDTTGGDQPARDPKTR
jgi:hypothetical protein